MADAAIATYTDPLMPMLGMSTNPASSAPTAAPAVFTKYSVLLWAAGSSERRANQRIAIGKVAPRASAGINTMTLHDRMRMTVNSVPPLPS